MGTFTGPFLQTHNATNPAAFNFKGPGIGNTTQTSLLDSTQMQLQQNLITILQQKCGEIAAIADQEVSKSQ